MVETAKTFLRLAKRDPPGYGIIALDRSTQINARNLRSGFPPGRGRMYVIKRLNNLNKRNSGL
jgi:hypothetical protein